MTIAIRKATAEDIEEIYLIEREGQARWNRRQFFDELKLKFSSMYVIEHNGRIAGFAVIWNVAGEKQLNNIGIKPERRRNGFGTKLLHYIIKSSPDGEATGKIYLEVSVQNTPAILFYKKNGFTEMGRRKNYYDGVDAILMERELIR